ncbi:uncharacterized protein [Triticum aestivum]|uniref:uncharacterized protein n=1 Tax=Triticum aestivum TaxID=4565 RepID=UPI001D020DB1|nr:uncharacterized protein LOC123127414 [Triticum aestivum]
MGIPLEKVWVRLSGVPETLLNDYLIVVSLGSLLGKTEKVDMPFTGLHGEVRLLVGVVNADYIPDFVPWTYDGMSYDLDIVVEEVQQANNNYGNTDVDMTDGGDGSRDGGGDPGMGGNPSDHSGKDKPARKPTQSTEPKTDKGSAPPTTPAASLRFGSFQAMSAPSRLWGDRVEIEDSDDDLPTQGVVVEEHRQMTNEVPPQLTSPRRPVTPVVTEVSMAAVTVEGRPSAILPSPTVEGSRPSRSLSPRSTSSTQVVSRSGNDDSTSAEICASDVANTDTVVEQFGRPVSPIASDLVGHTAGGHSPAGVALEDVIAFGGIPKPSSGNRRFSHRIQGRPDADDIQMG